MKKIIILFILIVGNSFLLYSQIVMPDSILLRDSIGLPDLQKRVYLSEFKWTNTDTITIDTNIFTLDQVEEMQNKSLSESSWLSSQEEILVFPSPEANNLISKIETSLNHYTGAINLNLPIYQLSSNDNVINIGLSYTESGIKANEIGSSVGIGWSLNAGGKITRVMHGLPDEFEGTVGPMCEESWFLGENYPCYPFPAYGYLNIVDRDGGTVLGDYLSYGQTKRKKIIKYGNWKALDGLNHGDGFGNGEAWDTQPDEFYFNFDKYSGKFVFDQNGNINLIPKQNLAIEKTISMYNIGDEQIPKISSFTVTTEEGYKYTFGDQSLSSVEESKLDRLVMTTQFAYQQSPYYLEQPNGVILYIYYRLPTINVKVRNNQMYYDTYNAPGNSSLSTYNYFTSTWQLESIRSPNNDIIQFDYESVPEYTYTQGRSQSVKVPNLSEIELEGGWAFLSPIFGTVKPGWCTTCYTYPDLHSFTYSVNEITLKAKKLKSITTQSGRSINFNANTPREDLIGDNRLDEIVVSDGQNIVKKYYLSYDIKESELDYDYYNFSPYDEDNTNGPYMDGDWDFANQKYQILTSNGSTIDPVEFAEKYLNIFSSEQKRMYLTNIIEVSSTGKIKPVNSFEYYSDGVFPRRNTFRRDHWGYFNNNTVGKTFPRIEYIGHGGDEVPRSGLPLIGWDNIGPQATSWSYLNPDLSPNLNKTKGGMIKKVHYPTGGRKEFYYELNKNGSSNVGGLRISKVRTFNNCNDETDYQEDNFDYFNGSVLQSLKYQYELQISPIGKVNIFAESSPVNSVNLTKGGVVGYEKVIESQTGNGKVIQTFVSPSEIPNVLSPVYSVYDNTSYTNIFPFPPDIDLDYQRGFINSSKITFNSELEIEKTIYLQNNEPSPSTYVYGILPATYYYWDDIEMFRAGLYKFRSGWVNTETITTTKYSSDSPGNGSKAITTSLSNLYEFDDNNSFQYRFLKEKISTSSDGKEFKETIKFPLDIDDPNEVFMSQTVINKMKEQGMVGVPLQEETSVESNIVQGKILSYDFQNGNINQIQPSKIYDLKGTEYTENIYFDKYDNNGNLLQQHTSEGINVAYYWGYENQYPIVKAENVTYNELASLIQSIQPSMETFLQDIGDLKTLQQRNFWNTFNNNLRSSLENSNISTFTYNTTFGMTSETGVNGLKKYYSYDSFGRLENIRDMDYHIIENYDYHYCQLFSLSQEEYNLECSAGSKTVSVTTGENWVALTDADWITISNGSGNGNGSFNFSYESNNTNKKRNAIIQISSTNSNIYIYVDQIACPYITADPTALFFHFVNPNGLTKTVDVSSNQSWSIIENETWISVNPSTGQGNSSFAVTCAENSGNDRTANILLTGNDGTNITIHIEQMGDPH